MIMSNSELSQSVALHEKGSDVTVNRRVLVVDDDEAILSTYRSILRPRSTGAESLLALLGEGPQETRESFDVVTATQGQEGVALVRESLSNNAPFSVAFLDMRMPPGWDGLRTAQAMRALDPDLYIVVASAYADYTADQIQTALNRDAVLLRKPFGRDEVYQLARTLAEGWTNRRALQDSNRALAAEVAQHISEREALQTKERVLTETLTRMVAMGAGFEGNLALLLAQAARATNAQGCYLATWEALDSGRITVRGEGAVAGSGVLQNGLSEGRAALAPILGLLDEVVEGSGSRIVVTTDTMAAPLLREGRLRGVVVCESVALERNWSAEDRELLATFVRIIDECLAMF